MNKVWGIFIIVAITFGMVACQKDLSVENYETINLFPTQNVPLAKGSLEDSTGNCQSIGINGTYNKGVALTTGNSIAVIVNFSTAGKYKIYTDTVNGCWFSTDSAITNNSGTQTITLQGYGTPIAADTANFNVFFTNSFCSFALVTDTVSSDSDYLPITPGTYWTYDTGVNPGVKDTLRYTIINQTYTVPSGNTYSLAIAENNDSEYYRKNYHGQYYRYFTGFAAYGLAFDYMILDETKNVGDTWVTPNFTGTFPSFGTITAYLQCEIIDKNITYTNKQGNTYPNVIHVQETFYLPPSGSGSPYAPFGNFDAYYAKGVGVIEYELPGLPSPIHLGLLRDYIHP